MEREAVGDNCLREGGAAVGGPAEEKGLGRATSRVDKTDVPAGIDGHSCFGAFLNIWGHLSWSRERAAAIDGAYEFYGTIGGAEETEQYIDISGWIDSNLRRRGSQRPGIGGCQVLRLGERITSIGT